MTSAGEPTSIAVFPLESLTSGAVAGELPTRRRFGWRFAQAELVLPMHGKERATTSAETVATKASPSASIVGGNTKAPTWARPTSSSTVGSTKVERLVRSRFTRSDARIPIGSPSINGSGNAGSSVSARAADKPVAVTAANTQCARRAFKEPAPR